MTLTFFKFKFPVLNLHSMEIESASAERKIPEHERASEERAFLRELLYQNPEAIQSELGLMAMMAQYPRHF